MCSGTKLLYLWSVEMNAPFREPGVYSSTEQVCAFPIAEKKLAYLEVGVT